jgi:hypothetical protein
MFFEQDFVIITVLRNETKGDLLAIWQPQSRTPTRELACMVSGVCRASLIEGIEESEDGSRTSRISQLETVLACDRKGLQNHRVYKIVVHIFLVNSLKCVKFLRISSLCPVDIHRQPQLAPG